MNSLFEIYKKKFCCIVFNHENHFLCLFQTKYFDIKKLVSSKELEPSPTNDRSFFENLSYHILIKQQLLLV